MQVIVSDLFLIVFQGCSITANFDDSSAPRSCQQLMNKTSKIKCFLPDFHSNRSVGELSAGLVFYHFFYFIRWDQWVTKMDSPTIPSPFHGNGKKKFMVMYSLGKILKLQDLRNIFFAMCHEVFEIWNFCHSNWLTTKLGTQQTLNTHFEFNFTSHTAVVSRKRLSKRWTTSMSRVSRWVSRYFLLTRITSS